MKECTRTEVFRICPVGDGFCVGFCVGEQQDENCWQCGASQVAQW